MPQYILLNESSGEIVEAFMAGSAYSAKEKCKTLITSAGSYLLCEVESRIIGTPIIKVENNDYPNVLFGGRYDPVPDTEQAE